MAVSAHLARQIAVVAMVDPRTVVGYLAGRPTRELTALRIRAALRQLDIPEPGGAVEAPARRGAVR